MSVIRIRELNCYYEKSGDRGCPVLLLHGWGQNTQMMAYIASFLSEHFTVYNLDLPGFGQSDEPLEAYSIYDYRDFLLAFMDEMQIKEPIIIGHSFGCRIAILLSLSRPVRRMCLTGAAGIRDDRDLAYYVKIYKYKIGKKVLSLKPFEKYLPKFQANAGSSDYKEASPVMKQTLIKVVNEDLKPYLKDVKCETLLVFGDKDEATPLIKGQMMEKEMPDATLVVFENDDHFAYFHQADRFNRVLEAFLKRDYD